MQKFPVSIKGIPTDLGCQHWCNGQFQIISIHNDRLLQHFNLCCLRKFQNALLPPCPQNSIIIKPPSPSEFPFLRQTLWNNQMCSQIRSTWVLIHQLVSYHPTIVIEGDVLIDSRNSKEKIEKNKQFLLTLVQQLQLQKFYIAPEH